MVDEHAKQKDKERMLLPSKGESDDKNAKAIVKGVSHLGCCITRFRMHLVSHGGIQS